MLRRKCRAGGTLSARLDATSHGLLIVGLRGGKASAFETLQLAGRMLKEASCRATSPDRTGHARPGGECLADALEALLAAHSPLHSRCPVSSQRRKMRWRFATSRSSIPGGTISRLQWPTSEGNNLARWLTALPANELTPASYPRGGRVLARREDWRVEFFDRAKLTRRGAGAFLAVTRAATRTVRASCTSSIAAPTLGGAPRTGRQGICFDTGAPT